ncbi:MAG: YnbE family lipoprotein [Pseudohongiella sp.]|nr:MAG: YnbE family lipoprotein [Pseudohongiella sp.]
MQSIDSLRSLALRSLRVASLFTPWVLVACTPTIQVAVPNEPITINLNVRIEHEIRVKVEEELDGIFTLDSGLF